MMHTVTVRYSVVHVNNTVKVRALCCSFDQVDRTIVTTADKYCSPDDAKFITSFIHNVAGDVTDMLCSNVNWDKCPEFVATFPDITLSEERAKSFAFPMILVLESF